MADVQQTSFELSGGSLALDFANTWGDRSRPGTDKLASYDELLAFADQAGILDHRQVAALAGQARRSPAAATRAMDASRQLREALYRVFSGRAAGRSADAADLERLSSRIARGARHLRLEPAAGAYSWRWQGLESSLEALLTPIARSAAELLTGADLPRVRECDGDDCTWLFLDTSRNRSRRWCSMESCGNRAKVRRHYRRSRRVRGSS